MSQHLCFLIRKYHIDSYLVSVSPVLFFSFQPDACFSLCLKKVGVLDMLSFEDCGPKAGELMAVVDLNYMELLKDAAVQSNLVILEVGHDFLAEVDKKDVCELLLGFEITFVPLNIGLDLVNIISSLKQGTHCLLSSLNVCDVRLALFNLLDESLNASLDALALVKSRIESVKIVDLTLDPVIKISERVTEIL